MQGAGLNEVQSSPRSAYIAGCLSNRLNPRASHLIRKDITQELHLEHFGMGDMLAEQLAHGIRQLPILHYINISDNNLTDRGMTSLLSCVTDMPTLCVLNMSDNVIGKKAACALEIFLKSAKCPLETLILRNANVDDYEGAMFIRALRNNSTLTELDLSKNLIGGAEILNSVRPDLITAVESLAELVSNPKCVLKSVIMAWNSIRLDSAVCFAKALSGNTSIKNLDLSFNSLADEGGRAIGEALLRNKSLRSLDLSNNNIGPAASFIICTAVEQNSSLRKLVLDNNPIGEAGAKAIMCLPAVVGNRVMLSAAECNIKMRESNCWFNQTEPCQKYRLDMTDSYERAIAYKLLTICAHHHSYEFITFSHERDKLDSLPINLTKKLMKHKLKYLTREEKNTLKCLYKIRDAARDVSLARELFKDFDVDHSGEIDKSELQELLKSLGMQIDGNQLSDAMSLIDVDDSGSIELPEFMNLIKDLRDDAIAKIKEMIELPVMVEVDSMMMYIPPDDGHLVIELKDSYVRKRHFQVLTSSDQSNISALASKLGTSPAQMIGYSFGTCKMRYREACEFYDTMLLDMADKTKVLSHILPQMIVPIEARMLVSKATNDDAVEVNLIRNFMGNALKPIFGLPCGFYRLDFSKEMDRLCLAKLLEYDGIFAALRRNNDPFGLGIVGDTSQFRNWSSFRNAHLDNVPIKISPSLFSPIPKVGILEFDFIGTIRPPIGQITISDAKFVKMLINLALIDAIQANDFIDKLKSITSRTDAALEGFSKPYLSCSRARAEKIALASDLFMKNLPQRGEDILAAQKKEELKHDITQGYTKRRNRKMSLTDLKAIMIDQDDTRGMLSVEHERAQAGVKQQAMTSFLSTLKAQRFVTSISSKNPDDSSTTTIDRCESEDHFDPLSLEEDDEVKEMRAIEQAKIDRANRLAKRRQTRSLIRIESLQAIQTEEESDVISESDIQSTAEPLHNEPKTVILPSITVVKDGKSITLPSLAVPKTSGQIQKSMTDDKEVKDDDDDEDSVDDGHLQEESKKRAKLRCKAVKSCVLLAAGMKGSGMANARMDKRSIQHRKNRRRLRELLSAQVSYEAKGVRLVAQIVDTLGMYWLRAKHVAFLVNTFKNFVRCEKYWGSYCIDLVVSLFSRLVDIHNFEIIMAEMTPSEAASLYMRLGWLNIFNPLKVEGSFELEMSRWEERMVAKIIMTLAMYEPGENIVDGTFQWDRDTEKTPGWVITSAWLSDDSMPRKGYLGLTFSSKANRDTKSDLIYRRALLSTVLIREEELRKEDEVATRIKTPGKQLLQKHKKYWLEYLYGDDDVENKITKLAGKVNTLV